MLETYCGFKFENLNNSAETPYFGTILGVWRVKNLDDFFRCCSQQKGKEMHAQRNTAKRAERVESVVPSKVAPLEVASNELPVPFAKGVVPPGCA